MKEALLYHNIDMLLNPRSIAIIGASAVSGKHGHKVVDNLVHCGFPGRIYPVNPRGGEIEGLKCYVSVADIPEPVDCAMLVIPASAALEAVRECAVAGVRAVVIGASGFAETGTAAGVERQLEMTRVARAAGMRILGPNTNGLLNVGARLSLGYNTEHADPGSGGSISIVSHSGALFGGVVRTIRRLGGGVSIFLPVGNEADISMLEAIDYLIDNPGTKVIGLILEGLADGQALRRLAQRAFEMGKSIIALKLGRSAIGRESTLAHSSRLAGQARSYDALFRSCGIGIVGSVEGLAAGCVLLSQRERRALLGDHRVVCIASSGAGGSLLADYCAASGISLAGDAKGEWEGDVAGVVGGLRSSGRIRNPIDTGSLAGDWTQIDTICGALERSGLNGPTIVYTHVAPTAKSNWDLLKTLVARRARTASPVIVVVPGGLNTALEAGYAADGIPLFGDIASAFDGLSCHFATMKGPDQALLAGGRHLVLEDAVQACTPNGNGLLGEVESALIVGLAGIQVVKSMRVGSAEEASRAYAELDGPVVMKAIVPDIAHKHDAGLVRLSITSAREAIATFESLVVQIEAFADGQVCEIIMQPMLRGKAELIVGVSLEPGLGHFLVVGLGGIYAEALDEVVLVHVPASQQAIGHALRKSRTGALLARIDGGLLLEVTMVLEKLQALVLAAPDLICSIDVNPLLVTVEGVTAVDALMVLRLGGGDEE